MIKSVLLAGLTVLSLAGCQMLPYHSPITEDKPPHKDYVLSKTSELAKSTQLALRDMTTLAPWLKKDYASVLVASMVEQDDLYKSRAVGRAVSRYLTHQFEERGFTARQIRIRDGMSSVSGSGLMPSEEVRAHAARMSAKTIVLGTYRIVGGQVNVQLNVVRAADGYLMLSHQFAIPMDDELTTLSKEK